MKLYNQYSDFKIEGFRAIFNITKLIETAYVKLAHSCSDVKKEDLKPLAQNYEG